MKKTTRLKKPQIPEIEDLYRFDDLGGRPKYGGVEMTHETDIPTYETIMGEVDGKIKVEADARSDKDTALKKDIDDEVLARQGADVVLQGQIDTIVASSDVKDIVGTYAALEAYDTSTLGDNDIIKVLQDETEEDQTTYYRWSTTAEEFSLIGAEGPYYTKAATDVLLGGKQNTLTAGDNIQISGDTISATDTTYSAGTNIQISAQNEISATDTTYTAGTGLDLTGTEFSIDNTVALKSEIPTDNAQLTNGAGYLTDTDIATSSSAGVIRVGASYGTSTTSSGNLFSPTKTYAAYSDAGDYMFIGKGTLENVITGKGLVDQTALATKQDKLTAGTNITIDANNVISATGGGSSGVSDVQIDGTSIVNAGIASIDYASSAAGGVFKTSSAYGQSITSTGQLFAVTKTYSEYSSANNAMFVSKGTLENVIDGKGLVDQTDLATKQDVLTAGTGISINNNVISATGGEAISAADWTALWADTLPIMNGVGV